MRLKQKGTVVEKLTEETLTDRGQLQRLLSICAGIGCSITILFYDLQLYRLSGALLQAIYACFLAAERTTEETAMNEASSRSHQIIRLVFLLSLNCLVIEIILLILFLNFFKMMIPADS